jgi:hypothetical protein
MPRKQGGGSQWPNPDLADVGLGSGSGLLSGEGQVDQLDGGCARQR